ncbi:MAG: hypothetical protein LBK02_02240 [Treponema sp.]|jgi:hypothetical protein|nr:hypothetical protein [Treponema sp.]
MEQDISSFGSDTWFPHIESLFLAYLTNIQHRPGGRFVCLKKPILDVKNGPLVKTYHELAARFKKEMFGEKSKDSFMDHHKIAALYIKAILITQPFFNDRPAETKIYEISWRSRLANEYFIIVYLSAIFKAWNGDCNKKLIIPQNYKRNLIKLFHHYLCTPQKLDVASLANTIYLIEQIYFR